MKRNEAIQKIVDEVVALKKSPLYKYRVDNNYLPVVGEGNVRAKIMFIGEAPGASEAKTGKPFMGAAGRVLNELFTSVGIKREEVYITSIVKDRPPENRDPTPKEIKIYGPFLDRQIDIIKPKVIVALGRFAMNYIMERLGLSHEIEPISKAHGKTYKATSSYGDVYILPLYHPAVALYNGSTKKVLIKDFAQLKKYA